MGLATRFSARLLYLSRCRRIMVYITTSMIMKQLLLAIFLALPMASMAQKYRLEAFFDLADSANASIPNGNKTTQALLDLTNSKKLKAYTQKDSKYMRLPLKDFQLLLNIESLPYYREAKQIRSVPDAQLTGLVSEMGELLAYYAAEDLQTFYWEEIFEMKDELFGRSPTYFGLYAPARLQPQGFDKQIGLYKFKKAERALQKQGLSAKALRMQVRQCNWLAVTDDDGNRVEWSWDSNGKLDEFASEGISAEALERLKMVLASWVNMPRV